MQTQLPLIERELSSLQRITSELYNLNEVMIDNPDQDEESELERGHDKSPCFRTLYRLFSCSNTFKSRFMFRMHMKMFKPKKDITLNTTEKVLELLQPVRYKPTSVDEMAEETKFSRSEVKFLYRAFKQECPNGIIDEETFKEVYENIFPLGDASKYAHLVFKCIDKEETGNII